MSRTWTIRGAGLLALVGIFGGCGHTVAPAFFESVDSGAVSGDDGGNGGFGVLPEGGSFIPSFSDAGLGAIGSSGNGPVMPTGPVTDFPAPIFDGTAPMNSDTLFGPPGQGAMSGGPCLVEPEGDAIFPQNCAFTPTTSLKTSSSTRPTSRGRCPGPCGMRSGRTHRQLR
jgi:hypothetical protein